MNKLVRIAMSALVSLSIAGACFEAGHYMTLRDPHILNVQDIHGVGVDNTFVYLGADKNHDGKIDFGVQYAVTGMSQSTIDMEYQGWANIK